MNVCVSAELGRGSEESTEQREPREKTVDFKQGGEERNVGRHVVANVLTALHT